MTTTKLEKELRAKVATLERDIDRRKKDYRGKVTDCLRFVTERDTLATENAELNALIDSREQLNAASISDLELECMKLERANARLREVLAGLVKSHEEWNDHIARVIGRPVNWTDSYLDAARHVLSNIQDEKSSPRKALD